MNIDEKNTQYTATQYNKIQLKARQFTNFTKIQITLEKCCIFREKKM